MDKIGKASVLKKVIQQTNPFFTYRDDIFFILIKGMTAKITIIPSVASGRSKSKGVAYNRVIITINVVAINEIDYMHQQTH